MTLHLHKKLAMKYAISFLYFCVFSLNLFAQGESGTASLTWGAGSRKGVTPDRFVGYDSKGNLLFFGEKETGTALLGGGATSSEACIITYDKDLKYKDYYPIEIPDLKVAGEEFYSLKNVKNTQAVTISDTSYIIGTIPGDGGLKISKRVTDWRDKRHF
jgi:hypothetical protein